MKSLKNKEQFNQLATDFVTEMKRREVNHSEISIKNSFKILFWTILTPYRAAYLFLLVTKGMATHFAWNYANKKTKKEIKASAQAFEWEF
jgi:hypothetical protein